MPRQTRTIAGSTLDKGQLWANGLNFIGGAFVLGAVLVSESYTRVTAGTGAALVLISSIAIYRLGVLQARHSAEQIALAKQLAADASERAEIAQLRISGMQDKRVLTAVQVREIESFIKSNSAMQEVLDRIWFFPDLDSEAAEFCRQLVATFDTVAECFMRERTGLAQPPYDKPTDASGDLLFLCMPRYLGLMSDFCAALSQVGIASSARSGPIDRVMVYVLKKKPV